MVRTFHCETSLDDLLVTDRHVIPQPFDELNRSTPHLPCSHTFSFPSSANQGPGRSKGKAKRLVDSLIFTRLDQEDWGKPENFPSHSNVATVIVLQLILHSWVSMSLKPLGEGSWQHLTLLHQLDCCAFGAALQIAWDSQGFFCKVNLLSWLQFIGKNQHSSDSP